MLVLVPRCCDKRGCQHFDIPSPLGHRDDLIGPDSQYIGNVGRLVAILRHDLAQFILVAIAADVPSMWLTGSFPT